MIENRSKILVVRIDRKTLNVVKDILKFKVLEELSEPFKIGTEVRQSNEFSPLLFSWSWRKFIWQWRKELMGKNIKYLLGTKNNNIDVDYFVFADDIAIFAEKIKETQIKILKEVAEKVGLNISFEKPVWKNFGAIKQTEKLTWKNVFNQLTKKRDHYRTRNKEWN